MKETPANKLKVRFPGKFSNERALNRDIGAERAELERPGVIKGSADRIDNEGGSIDWSGGGVEEVPLNPTESKE